MIDSETYVMSAKEWFYRIADPEEINPPCMVFEQEDEILDFLRELSWIARDNDMTAETFFELTPQIIDNIALLRTVH